MKKTVLSYFRDKIEDCKKVGRTTLWRHTMLKECYTGNKNYKHLITHYSQFDSIRRQLTVCGYLKETSNRGFYRILKSIEPGLTSSQLRKMYDERDKSKV